MLLVRGEFAIELTYGNTRTPTASAAGVFPFSVGDMRRPSARNTAGRKRRAYASCATVIAGR